MNNLDALGTVAPAALKSLVDNDNKLNLDGTRAFTFEDRLTTDVLKDKLSFGPCGRLYIWIAEAFGWHDDVAHMVAFNGKTVSWS